MNLGFKAMNYDVIEAKYLSDYKIKVTFEDGKTGIIDFKSFINKGGVFDKFKDKEYFKNFKVNPEMGTITWGDDEVDVAETPFIPLLPAALYQNDISPPLYIEKDG